MKKKITHIVLKWIRYILQLSGFAILLSVCLWSADYLMYWLGLYIKPYFHADSFALAVLLSFFILQFKSNFLYYGIMSILLLFVYAGFFHYSYFGRYFTGYDISLFFHETTDTVLAFFDMFFRYGQLFVLILLFFVLTIFLRCYTAKRLYRSNLMIVPFLVCLAIIPIQNIKRGGEFSFPNATQFMYFNALKSVSSYCVDIVAKHQEQKSFLPYEITLTDISSQPITIIYVMGEGLSASHLSLFGYERKTTPFLEQWTQKDNFYYSKGFAGATITRNAISGFMNFQKEPENYTLVQSKKHNLFKLAKQADFQTTFMSAQTFSSFPHVGLEYTDNSFYRSKNGAKDIAGDEFWLESLKELPLKDKNFIVIQMRAVHLPYAKTWQHRFNEFNRFSGSEDERIDAYDNGVLYVDDILNQVLTYASQLSGQVYVFFASDHNELFGEYGLYGHITLHPFVARIPLFVWTNQQNTLTDFQQIQNPTHWDIGRQILNLMGYRVSNPNTAEDVIFVQGSDPTGAGGFLTLKRNGEYVLDENGKNIP